MQNIARPVISFLAPALALSACATTSAPTSEQADVVERTNVALGQKAFVDGPIVQPVEVIEDSRCPANVLCVHAGRLRLKMLWLRPGGRQQAFEVTLGERTPLADGTILLERVSPARASSAEPVDPGDYRFDFRFDGGF